MWWQSVIVVVLLGITLVGCLVAPVPQGATVPGVTMSLPYRVGGWWGIDQEVSWAEKTILPSDTEFARKSYESALGNNLLCSIVLSGAERRSIHKPEICLPAQGWTVTGSQVVSVPLHSGHDLQVMNLTLKRSIQTPQGDRILTSYYMYWFVGDGVTTPYHWRRIWLTSWDRIARQVQHRWAYVIVTSPILEGLKPGGKSPAETLAMMKQFVADAIPSFQKSEMPPGS